MLKCVRNHSGWLLLVLMVAGLVLALRLTNVEATPFQSPTPANTIHQPLITNNGATVPLPTTLENQGIPIIWLIALLLLLFVPAAAYFATRRRP